MIVFRIKYYFVPGLTLDSGSWEVNAEDVVGAQSGAGGTCRASATLENIFLLFLDCEILVPDLVFSL